MDEQIITQKSALFNLNAFPILSFSVFQSRFSKLYIFIHCPRNDHEKCWHPTRNTLVNVSYVCRHWRNVVLNCSMLWTYLFATSPRWTEDLLARSQQSLLKVHVDAHHWDGISRDLDFVDQVMNHVERIQELRLHLSGLPLFQRSDYDLLPNKLSSRCPHPHILQISAASGSSGFRWSSVPFDGDTPALRTLKLLHCPVSWNSFKLSGLTTLSLRSVPVRFRQHTMEFLASLSCMRYLTHLYLDGALASATGLLSCPAFHTFQKIELSHLSLLCLVAPLSTAIAFLSCVNISLKSEIRLKCCSEHDSSLDHYASLGSLLKQRFGMSEDHALSSPTIRSLAIRRDAEYWRELKLTVSVLEHECDSFFMPYSDLFEDSNIPLQIDVFPDRPIGGKMIPS